MNTWKVVFATLSIFVAGVITGGVVVGFTNHTWQLKHFWSSRPLEMANVQNSAASPREPNRMSGLPNPVPQVLRKDFLQKLDREVRLTADQREQIEKILTEGQQHAKQLWEPIAPQMREEMAEVHQRIRAVLTSEQAAKFDELMKQRAKNVRRFMGSPTNGAPPPLPANPPQNP